MPRKIELFIRTKEYRPRNTEPFEHIKHQRNWHIIGGYDYKLTSSVDEWLSPEEVRAKNLVENFAKRHGLKLAIRDRHRFWDNVRARFKGVEATPMVILGKCRLGPDISAEQLEGAL